MIKVSRPELCTGCLICVMACSFHHTKRFSKSESSISVKKDIMKSNEVPKIHISYKKNITLKACDLCSDEKYPFCAFFCPQNVFKVERSKT